MRKFLIRVLNLFFTVLFPGFLVAQQDQDYTILLNSGKFTPSENIGTVNKDSEVFKQSLFIDKYYVMLQFKNLPKEEEKARLERLGIRLIDYIPNKAFAALVPANFNLAQFQDFSIRSVFTLSARQKTVPAMLAGNFPEHAVKKAGYVDVTVITYETLGSEKIAEELSDIKAIILKDMPMFRSFIIRVPQKKVLELVNQPFVQWVEPVDPPNVRENQLGRSLHRVSALNEGFRNLNGDGIKVGIWDGGEVSPHIDFSPIASRLTMMESSAASDHATHVAGTIGGKGIIDPKAKGMASKATLYSYDFNGYIQSEMATAIPTLGLDVSSHSYGSTQTCGITGAGVAYSSTSRSTDINLNNNPSHLHVHSAGNSQTACAGGWSTITGSGKTAKNNILVANINSSEVISGSSSFGPVADGRVKPEISAFGTNVLSTFLPLNTYATISGTSMATPGVSGSVALLVQRYKQLNSNVAPISSLIKAVVCNNAADLGNAGPDYKFGFGRLNALSAVRVLEENRYRVNTISSGSTNDIIITVPAAAARLKVMLAWNDPAGAANANPALVNNLDFSVISGPTTTLPWILNPANPNANATRGVDNVSNIEQITIDNPAAGNYTLRINGSSIPMGPQQYSLTWTIEQPYIEVIFPNGGESLSPGSQETITWDNAGITGNQTVQYSLDNGTNWITLSNSVSANTTRYIWTVPAGLNTSTALIRVFSGAITDVSNANFRILDTPRNLNVVDGACPGALIFTWTAVANATHYDLFRLDANTGEWTILAANISGTSYNANLAPGTSMWFAISAKNTSSASISEKGLAINITPGAGASSSIGAVAGPASICGGNQNVTYSVPASPGISAYTWSVPAGATLISGQGTTSIVVGFTPGSSSGTVSVFGTSGGCQSATSTLSVTVNSSLVTVSSTTNGSSCGAGSVTLAAIPSAGSNINWYSSPAGGSPIHAGNTYTPTIAATTTYYAAASTGGAGNVGATTNTIGTGAQSTATQWLLFDVFALTTLQGVFVYPGAAGNVVLEWKSNTGSVIQTATVAVLAAQVGTKTFIPLNWNLTPGSGYRLALGTGSVSLFRNDTGASYPYTYPGVLSITGNSFNSTYYYWGYDWQVGTGCESGRVPVTATINPLPAAPIASYNTNLIYGGTLQLTASTLSGATYSWTGPNSFTSTSQNPTISNFSILHTGTYSVTAVVNGCSGAAGTVDVYIDRTVSGIVKSEHNTPINTVTLTTSGGSAQSSTTNATGAYSFNFSSGGNYSIVATKSNDVTANNGITTSDIVLIRRQILGIQALGSPYKILAADVNSSDDVTTADIAQMRSIILGVSTNFNGQQWKFVPSNYVFATPSYPFPYTSAVSTLSLPNLSSSQTVDFIGIKLGDVNNSWDNTIARLQAAGDLYMLLPSKLIGPNDTVVVPVKVKDFNNISGYQFTMEWDKQVLQYIGVVPAALQGAYGQQQVANGKLTTTWDEPAGQHLSLADSTVVFKLHFKAVGSIGASSALNITSSLTKADGYNNQLAPLNILFTAGRVQIGKVTGIREGLSQGYTFFQNYPNPFSANTTFSFILPKAEKVKLVIYNSLGQVVATHQGSYGSGEHALELKNMQLSKALSSGSYIISFSAGNFLANRKIIILND